MVRGIVVLVLGRLAFCSEMCFNAALDTDQKPSTLRVHPEVAPVIQCYGCGFHGDEWSA